VNIPELDKVANAAAVQVLASRDDPRLTNQLLQEMVHGRNFAESIFLLGAVAQRLAMIISLDGQMIDGFMGEGVYDGLVQTTALRLAETGNTP
jgi:hypothetical protein